MIKFSLLVAAAVSALAASPVAARPMTAVDLQSIHRLGAPAISPDGRTAVFTISDTDWTKNKRVNTLYRLDLSRPGARPQPIAGAAKGHDAMFSGDGALWFLMPVGDQDQLFRMPAGGAPLQVSNFHGDIGGFKVSDAGNRVVVWADRNLRCADLDCAGLPEANKIGSGRTYDQLFIRHWDSWAEPGVRSRLFAFPVAGGKLGGAGVPVEGNLVGDTPSKPFGGGEEIALSPDGRTVYFALARGGPDRAAVDQPRHLRRPGRRERSAGQPHRRQRCHRHAADGLAGRPHARLCRHGAARLRIRSPGADAARSRHRPGPRR